MKKKTSQKGILIVEALLSIVVLSTAITATVRSFTYSSKTHLLTKNYMIALDLAQEKMSEIEETHKIQPGELQGAFPLPYQNFSWKVSISELFPHEENSEQEKSEDIPKYFKVSLTVNWKSREERFISLDTVIVEKNETHNTNEDSTQKSSDGKSQEVSRGIDPD